MDALPAIIQAYGGAGAILIVAGYALKRMHDQITAVQEKRVQDAQAFAAKLLEAIEAKRKGDELLAQAMDGTSDAVQAIHVYLQAQRDADRDRALTGERFPVMGPPGVGRKTRG